MTFVPRRCWAIVRGSKTGFTNTQIAALENGRTSDPPCRCFRISLEPAGSTGQYPRAAAAQWAGSLNINGVTKTPRVARSAVVR